MNYQLIQSDSNAKFKRWKKLAENTRFIKKEGMTLAEGAHLLITLDQKNIRPAALLMRASGVTDEVAGIAQRLSEEGVPSYVLENRLYDQISPVEHGAGIIAEVPIICESLPEHEACDVLYLDGVQDPGNVGTLIRTAVASGVKVIAASRETASLWSPKALRAAMGAHFGAKLFENVEAADLVKAFDARRLAADARGGSDIFLTDGWDLGHTVWMMGAEGPGLSDRALAVADQRLYIPIEKDCESLNVGAAASVCLFEQRRRRLTRKTVKIMPLENK